MSFVRDSSFGPPPWRPTSSGRFGGSAMFMHTHARWQGYEMTRGEFGVRVDLSTSCPGYELTWFRHYSVNFVILKLLVAQICYKQNDKLYFPEMHRFYHEIVHFMDFHARKEVALLSANTEKWRSTHWFLVIKLNLLLHFKSLSSHQGSKLNFQ